MNYFYINNIPFRASNSLKEKRLGWTASERSFNGTLIVQQFNWPEKKEQTWEFMILTSEEFDQLFSFKDQVVTVRSEIEGHEFDMQALLTIPGQYEHGFAGTRQNITVNIEEV